MKQRWIKVEVNQESGHGFRVFCRNCGHDDYRPTHEEAMNRAHEMWRDHIPFDPQGELSCSNWTPYEEWPDAEEWEWDAFRWLRHD